MRELISLATLHHDVMHVVQFNGYSHPVPNSLEAYYCSAEEKPSMSPYCFPGAVEDFITC